MHADQYARETASDRPGVAQPVPKRPVPVQPWGRILLLAALLFALLLGGWEGYWRSQGVRPAIRNSLGLWAIQRRRIDHGEGQATVLVGASRLYFDTQLPVWRQKSGQPPIQLSFEGTSPLTALEDLAADERFTGRVLIGVEPDLIFSGFGLATKAASYAHKESPAQRIGQWLSMSFIEPYFAFDDADFALRTVLARQPWPPRPGRKWGHDVRRLAIHDAQRNAYLWSKVVDDPEYRALARSIWCENFVPSPEDPTPAEVLKTEQEQIQRAVKAAQRLRGRGVQMLFVRLPSDGPFFAFEEQTHPRERSWSKLLADTQVPGIYFQDYPELTGYYLPEWSHMTRDGAERFTAALYKIIDRDFWPQQPAPQTARATP